MTATDDPRQQYDTKQLKAHDTAMRWRDRWQWAQLNRGQDRILWDLIPDEAEQLRSDLEFLSSIGAPFGRSACNRLARDKNNTWADLERLAMLVGESPLDWLDVWLSAGKKPEPDGGWLEGYKYIRDW